MSITDIKPATAYSNHPSHSKAEAVQVIVYGHSGLFYWWPLWLTGYSMALLTGRGPTIRSPFKQNGVVLPQPKFGRYLHHAPALADSGQQHRRSRA